MGFTLQYNVRQNKLSSLLISLSVATVRINVISDCYLACVFYWSEELRIWPTHICCMPFSLKLIVCLIQQQVTAMLSEAYFFPKIDNAVVYDHNNHDTGRSLIKWWCRIKCFIDRLNDNTMILVPFFKIYLLSSVTNLSSMVQVGRCRTLTGLRVVIKTSPWLQRVHSLSSSKRHSALILLLTTQALSQSSPPRQHSPFLSFPLIVVKASCAWDLQLA